MKRGRNKAPVETTNPYKLARLRAAAEMPELETAENAAGLLLIRREKYLKIEQDDPMRKTAEPNADEVCRMVQLYRAPELRSHYCANVCPLGDGSVSDCTDSLDRISVRLMIALRRMEQARDEMDNILQDGRVGENEEEAFRKIVRTLKEIAGQADALEAWAQRRGLMEFPKV